MPKDEKTLQSKRVQEGGHIPPPPFTSSFGMTGDFIPSLHIISTDEWRERWRFGTPQGTEGPTGFSPLTPSMDHPLADTVESLRQLGQSIRRTNESMRSHLENMIKQQQEAIDQLADLQKKEAE